VVGPATYPEEFAYLGLKEARRCDEAEQKLNSLAKSLIPREVPVEITVETGIAFDVIVEMAKKMNVDLIITTTQGHTGLSRAMIGSTAERVVRHAPCPVLVVREHEREFV
jgi:nucleotide-binding universal stress UspA family protein